MSDWRDIETAPKDGREILTLAANGSVAVAKYYENPFGRKNTVIDDASGRWWTVTHWARIPPPPAPN